MHLLCRYQPWKMFPIAAIGIYVTLHSTNITRTSQIPLRNDIILVFKIFAVSSMCAFKSGNILGCLFTPADTYLYLWTLPAVIYPSNDFDCNRSLSESIVASIVSLFLVLFSLFLAQTPSANYNENYP